MKFRALLDGTALRTDSLRRWKNAACLCNWHAQGIETLLESGKRNPAAGIMLALLSEIARNETETLRERIKSGLAEARRKGVKLGRPQGALAPELFLLRHKDIVRLLKGGQSIRNAAKIADKGPSTVWRVKLALIS
jgi:DNA invertase Pin-like site-specific DNA recombinase